MRHSHRRYMHIRQVDTGRRSGRMSVFFSYAFFSFLQKSRKNCREAVLIFRLRRAYAVRRYQVQIDIKFADARYSLEMGPETHFIGKADRAAGRFRDAHRHEGSPALDILLKWDPKPISSAKPTEKIVFVCAGSRADRENRVCECLAGRAE